MPKKKILIIDDEETNCKLLSARISQCEDYEPIVARSGQEGLELIKTQPPDLVLLDIMMPQMDGMETLKRIKALKPDLPVAMVTANWNAEEAKRAFAEGAYEYITKPVDFDYLRTALLVKLL